MRDGHVGRTATIVSTVCVAVLGLTMLAAAVPSVRKAVGLGPAGPVRSVVGQRINVPTSVYDASDYTVVLFVQASCAACQHWKPWLTTLVGTWQQSRAVRVVVGALDSTLSDEVQFAAEIGLERERVIPLTFETLRNRRVPTVVLVDRAGTVRYEYDDEAPTPARQAQVLEQIKAMAGSR